VFDNPGLIAVAVVGDGEAETSPLEGSWKGIKFLNAARDGARSSPGGTACSPPTRRSR
jgi:xylulose-5-phosphate/fructose-6-phosphate phosphoketolase